MKRIVCIVEGDGEVEALPVVLRRMLSDLNIHDVELARPLRTHRDKFLRQEKERSKFVETAKAYLGQSGVILVLLDSDDDLICELVAAHLAALQSLAAPHRIGFVLAAREFEAWFIAGIESLRGVRGIRADIARPDAPDTIRNAKGWIRSAMSPRAYQETIDQAKLAAQVDWREARRYSPSLDKLCREVARLLDLPALA